MQNIGYYLNMGSKQEQGLLKFMMELSAPIIALQRPPFSNLSIVKDKSLEIYGEKVATYHGCMDKVSAKKVVLQPDFLKEHFHADNLPKPKKIGLGQRSVFKNEA